MGRKRKRRSRRNDDERRSRGRDERRNESGEDDEQAFTPMGMPDAPIPDAPIPDATPPDVTPSVGLPGMANVDPIPQTDRVPMASRGYGHEAQEHIMRATEGTETDPYDVPDPVLDVLATGSGQSLDASIQRTLEERMDADFSTVEIHTGPEAAKAADAIDARAFTCGNAIVFNDGEYDPESADGQHLLAHELAHVKQQTGGANGVRAAGVASGSEATRETGAAISMMPQADADLEIDPDQQLEREAEQAAEEALSGEEPLIVNRLGTDVHVQRSAKGDSMTYEGLDNLTEAVADLRETVSQNQSEIQETKSNLGTLEDEVHSGFGEKALGVAGGGVAAGGVALGRAASEPALQDVLAEAGTNPDLAAPAMAAAVMAAGVGAVGIGAKGLLDRARERFLGDGTDEQEHVESDETGGTFETVRDLVR